MRIQDEQRTRQMIEDLIGKPFEEIIGRLNVLNAHVSRVEGNTDRIEKHVEKTNGRVTKLEDEIEKMYRGSLSHMTSCPNTKKIEILEKDRFGRVSIVRFVIGVIAVSGTLVGILKAFGL